MLLVLVEELLRFVSACAQSRSPLCLLLLDLSDCGFSPGMTPDDPFSVIQTKAGPRHCLRASETIISVFCGSSQGA